MSKAYHDGRITPVRAKHTVGILLFMNKQCNVSTCENCFIVSLLQRLLGTSPPPPPKK